MTLPRPVSFSFDQLSIDFDIDIARNVNSTDSHSENVDVDQVAELWLIQVLTRRRKWKVEAHTFQDL